MFFVLGLPGRAIAAPEIRYITIQLAAFDEGRYSGESIRANCLHISGNDLIGRDRFLLGNCCRLQQTQRADMDRCLEPGSQGHDASTLLARCSSEKSYTFARGRIAQHEVLPPPFPRLSFTP